MQNRKEIKDEYKRKKAPMGVFCIRNLSNNRALIDNSVDMTSKMNRHRAELKFGKHKNAALQKDWSELGETGFAFEVLSTLEAKDKDGIEYQDELKQLQQMVLDELNLGKEQLY